MSVLHDTDSQQPAQLIPLGIELTNICNLKCPECPTPTTKALRGMAEDATVRRALEVAVKGHYFALHGMGEPLLHPKLKQYVKWAADAGVVPHLSTNGVLLTEQLFHELRDLGLREMRISLHTPQSVTAYKIVATFLVENGIEESEFKFWSNLLKSNQDIDGWLKQQNVTDELGKYIRRINVHTWLGTVEGKQNIYSPEVVKRRMSNCFFITQNYCDIAWDGTVRACCLDSENINVIGHIRDFEKLRHLPDTYQQCRYCDPNWANKEMMTATGV